ncbi:MAG: hypothetical protein JWN46_2036 [Acidimicrobiales bacterium]|nr:hypothetical protein [Acidimicrobiales bacterium]
MVLMVVTACSSGGKSAPTTPARPVLNFALGKENTDPLGVCRVFTPASIKKLVGGDRKFRVYPPQSLAGQGGPKTTGVVCSWDRSTSPDQVSLRIMVVDYAKAQSGLIDSSWKSQVSGLGTTSSVTLGDQGVSASANGIATVLVRKGSFLISAVSQGRGNGTPIAVGQLTFLAGAAMRKVAP